MASPEILIDTDKATRSVFYTGAITEAPQFAAAYSAANQAYLLAPQETLVHIEDSILNFTSATGETVPCSLLYDGRSKADEMLVIFAPFADGPPKSSSKEIYNYTRLEAPGFGDKQIAKPNSWNQATKSKTVFEVLAAMEEGMPVLTIFSPLPPKAYQPVERKAFGKGNYAPAGVMTLRAVRRAQEILHGHSSPTQIDKLHLHGASLGASNAIGAAAAISRLSDERQVLTVTAQELILGPKKLTDLAARFTIKSVVGEASNYDPAMRFLRLEEPALRKVIDAHGNELAMFLRTARAMTKVAYLAGLTRPERIVNNVEDLLAQGTKISVPLAANSALTHETASYLPKGEDNLQVINVKAIKDQKATHLIDEHVGLVAATTVLGISKKAV